MIKKYRAEKLGVHFANWETPLSRAYYIHVHYVFQAPAELIIFFYARHEGSEGPQKIHIMRISRRYPYRSFDENYADSLSECVYSKKNKNNSNTCIVWNTPFLKEMDIKNELSGIGKEKNKKLFMYVIKTWDEWFEFFSHDPPEWKTYPYRKNRDKELLKKYVAKYG